MQTSAGWMLDTPSLACLAGLGRTDALRKLKDDPAAAAAMYASDHLRSAQRWADRWARNEAAYWRALYRGFAAQADVQNGAMTLAEAERWAFPELGREMHREFPLGGLEGAGSVRGRPIVGADLGPASFAADMIEGWLRDLERHILADHPTEAARAFLTENGVELLRGLGNHFAQLPEGAGGPDSDLRCLRRVWPQIVVGGVSRAQTDAARRLFIGTCANDNKTQGKSVGIVQWTARGHTIAQARRFPPVANSWAVSVDQADPVVARLSREDRRQRQKGVRRRTERRIATPVQTPLRIEVTRPQRRGHAAAA